MPPQTTITLTTNTPVITNAGNREWKTSMRRSLSPSYLGCYALAVAESDRKVTYSPPLPPVRRYVDLPGPVAADLDAYCRDNYASRAAVIRAALVRYLRMERDRERSRP